jgi:anti-sigma regulatory factor (Ser/Thr protein kinase)
LTPSQKGYTGSIYTPLVEQQVRAMRDFHADSRAERRPGSRSFNAVIGEAEDRALRARINLELPHEGLSVPVCRHLVRQLLEEQAADAERAGEIELAVSEAIGNVIQHARVPPGQLYHVRIDCFPDRLCFQVEDRGQGFVRTAVPHPDDQRPDGRGVWLMEQLADRLTIQVVKGGGCRLKAEFRFGKAISG